jgi:hypothetical protein
VSIPGWPFTILDFPGEQRSAVYLTGQDHRVLIAADQVVRDERLFAQLLTPP